MKSVVYVLIADWGISRSICVVNNSIKGLIDPLPENHSRSGPVESHHATSDDHVARNLGTHPANNQHLLSSVRMESWVIDMFGFPQLINSQAIQLPIFPT